MLTILKIHEIVQFWTDKIDPTNAELREGIADCVRTRAAQLNELDRRNPIINPVQSQEGYARAKGLTEDLVALFVALGTNARDHKWSMTDANGKKLWLKRVDYQNSAYYTYDHSQWLSALPNKGLDVRKTLRRLAHEYRTEVLDGWLGQTDRLLGEVINELAGAKLIPQSVIDDKEFA